MQRADEIAVEPRKLGRDHRDPRLIAERDAEELAVVDAPTDQLDAELAALQAADERCFPRRTAGARDDAYRMRHGSSRDVEA